jgi:hypothetical protein
VFASKTKKNKENGQSINMGNPIKLRKTANGEIIFRSYCMESGEVGDWCVTPYCEKCGDLEERQIDFGDAAGGLTEAWYVPVCRLCGNVLPNQRKI